MNFFKKPGQILFLTVGMIQAACLAQATITSASISNDIPAETVGVTSTSITYTLDNTAPVNNIEIDVYHLKDVSDVPGPTNQVLGLPQTGVAGGMSHTVPWDALWAVQGNNGRQDGLFKVILTDLGTSATFAISTFLNITSVDIHGVTSTPSFDANQNPALPYIITYALAKDCLVTIQVVDTLGNVVRTLANNAPQFGELVKPSNTILWDGLNDNGRPVPPAIYTVKINAKDPLTTDVAIQRTATATLQSLANLNSDPQQTFQTNAFVYPNPVRSGNAATACGSPACFQFLAVRPNANITLKIYTIDGTLVRSESFGGLTTGNIVTFNWDATNQSGKTLGRGLYYFVAREEDEAGTLQTVKKMAIIR